MSATLSIASPATPQLSGLSIMLPILVIAMMDTLMQLSSYVLSANILVKLVEMIVLV